MSPDTLVRRTGNRLIDSLPKDVAKRLSFLENSEDVRQGDVVYRQDVPTSHVYFPVSAVYSHVVPLKDGKRIQAVTIGNEGMLGLHFVLGLDFSPTMTVCQVPGEALRLPAHAFLDLVRPGNYLDHLLRRYAAFYFRCAHQTAACNTTHSVEERICRWLLMIHDRTGTDEFSLTHESIAEALGIRRPTVTLVARTLRVAGFIQYQRGVVRVLDRRGLERISCECYQASRTAYESIVRNGRAAQYQR